MGIQEINRKGKDNIAEYQNKRQPGKAELFQRSLMQNIRSQDQENAGEAPDKTRMGIEDGETEARVCRGEERTGVGVAQNTARIRVNEVTRREAVQTAEVRHMSYEESDNIEIAVTEGYTLKGRLEGRQVYVEAKYEDGRMEAYRVDTEKVQEQTTHRIEQFALETVSSREG